MFLVVIWPCFWIDHHRKQAQLYIKHFLCKVNSPFFTLRTGNVRKVEIFHPDHWDDMAQSPVKKTYVEIPFIEQLKGMGSAMFLSRQNLKNMRSSLKKQIS